MTKAVSDLLPNVDSGCQSLLLSLDISADFDTFNHKRFLQRSRDPFCFTGQSILWLKSYLSDRRSCQLAGLTLLHTVLVFQCTYDTELWTSQ